MVTISFCNKRMLSLMQFVVANKINGITNKTNFLASIGFNNLSNLVQVENGKQSFTVEQLIAACELYNIDGNWFLNPKFTKMTYVSGEKFNPVKNLKEAVEIIISDRQKISKSLS